MTSTYRANTIRDKALQPFRDTIGMNCFCGVKIKKKNLAYYRNELGELKPICRKCGELIQSDLEVVFPLPKSKTRRYKIK